MNNKWTYNLGNKEHWDSEEMFETREEAIKEGKLEAIKCDFVEYEVGMVEEFISFIDTEDAIEIINERAYNEVGECAESYLENLEKDELHELHEKINDVFQDWMNKTNNKPHFWKIVNITGHEVDDDKRD